MSIWDEPEMQPEETAYVKFEKVGDGITGTIKDVSTHTFEDGKKAPALTITTGPDAEKTLTAGQMKLKAALAELRPEAGDWISIKLIHIEKRPGGKTLKHFTVEAKRNGVPLVPVDKDAAPAADLLAALTPEQRKAIADAQTSEIPF